MEQRHVTNVITKLQCVAQLAGHVGEAVTPDTAGLMYTSVAFESPQWPKPAQCAFRQETSTFNLEAHMESLEKKGNNGTDEVKLVNHARGLEFRPILKSGSMFLRNLLTCLQPEEWEATPQTEPMPPTYTALVVVRDPIRRFVSAVVEMYRRLFTGACPTGPCGPSDYFYLGEETAPLSGYRGKTDQLDNIAYRKPAAYFYHARRFYNDEPGVRTIGSPERQDAIRQMLAAAVTDTSCSAMYYASEHVVTQMAQVMQGTDVKLNPQQVAITFRLEDMGTTTADLIESRFFEAIGARSIPTQKVSECIASSASNHDTTFEERVVQEQHDAEVAARRVKAKSVAALKGQVATAAGKVAGAARSVAAVAATQLLAKSQAEDAPAQSGAAPVSEVAEAAEAVAAAMAADAADERSRVYGSQYDNDDGVALATLDEFGLPDEHELYDALMGEHALLIQICYVYAQDSLCLAHEYELPEPCRAMFDA